MVEPKCCRCGFCCFEFSNNGLKPCKYLTYEDSKAICKIYELRLTMSINNEDEEFRFCKLRHTSSFDYPGCPYNVGKDVKFTRFEIEEAIKKHFNVEIRK